MKMRLLFLLAMSAMLVGCGGEAEPSKKEAPEDTASATKAAEAEVAKKAEAEAAKKAEAVAKVAFEKIESEFDDAMDEFRKEYEAAAPKDKRKLVQDKLPKADDYKDRFMEVYEAHSDSESGVKALEWVASRVRDANVRKEALNTLLTKHIDSEALKTQAMGMARTVSEETANNLKRLMEESPHDSVKGAATFAMAGFMDTVISAKDNPARYGKEAAEYIKNSDFTPEQVLAQYKLVADKYADIDMGRGTLGEMAAGSIFEMENLSIGNVAPDIEAEDLEGVSFKLSDYRGKVVVLDFWGDW